VSTAADGAGPEPADDGSTHRGVDAPGAGRPRIGLIWAQAQGGVIGAGGTMPWHLPEDLKHFSRTTKGAPVVMGRRTWESFPPRYRPLPGRTNIVITRDDSFADQGAVRARDLTDALELAGEALAAASAGTPTVWVIGGGAVYRETIDQADLLVVTEIDLEVAGDTAAPEIPASFSRAASDPESGWHEAANGLRYRVLTYAR
jgi:dihydrofolate reductase